VTAVDMDGTLGIDQDAAEYPLIAGAVRGLTLSPWAAFLDALNTFATWKELCEVDGVDNAGAAFAAFYDAAWTALWSDIPACARCRTRFPVQEWLPAATSKDYCLRCLSRVAAEAPELGTVEGWRTNHLRVLTDAAAREAEAAQLVAPVRYRPRVEWPHTYGNELTAGLVR
jgi:hypothetical protein